MITTAKKTINERDLESFLSDLHTKSILKKTELTENDIMGKLRSEAEKAGWIIDNLLPSLEQHITDKQLRNQYRRFLISQKFGILPRYSSFRTDKYYISHASDYCVLVNCPGKRSFDYINNVIRISYSTIILSPAGEITVPEGNVQLLENSITSHGFYAKWDGYFGLYSPLGDMVLPCIFDSIECKDYEPMVHLCYKGVYYLCYIMPYRALLKYDDIIFVVRDNGLFLNKKRVIQLNSSILPSYLHNTQGFWQKKIESADEIKKNTEELINRISRYYHHLKEGECTCDNVFAVLSKYLPEDNALKLSKKITE